MKNPKHYYTSYAQLLKDVEVDGKIKAGTPIVFTGKLGGVDYQSKITTYGRLRISKIIEADLDEIKVGGKPVIGPYERINAKSAARLMSYLYGYEDWVEKANKLQKVGLKYVTRTGVATFDYSTLYANTDNDTYKEIRNIADSTELTDKQKLMLISEKYNGYLKTVENEFSDDLKGELDRAARVKLSSIIAINAPSFIVSGIDEKPILTRGNLLQGFTEEEYIAHAIENRSLQSIKQSGVPLGGYMNRQITFLLNNYKFKAEGSDPNNEGLLIPRYVATGRTAPNGKVYGEVTRQNEDDLVPVRSVIMKREGDLDIITPDLLSKNFLKTDTPDGSALGLSAGASFSEATTQSILGLKHGGHERVLDFSGNLYAPKDCELREEGRWLVLKVRGGELRYPRPDNWVGIPKQKYAAGELIGTAYHTTSPVYKLNAVIRLMNAKGSSGIKYYEKDNVVVADCYAYEAGTIHYVENKHGEIEVFIGGRQYAYSPESIYYFPDGAEIKKYQRFCSGVVNMRQVTADLPGDINGAFNIFRNQYYSLTSSDFQKKGIVSPSDMQEEIVEMVFSGLTNMVADPKTNKVEEIEYLGTQNAILSRKSFFTTLSYGWSSRIIGRALKGELNLEGDTMTSTVLNLLLNDKLDSK